MIIVIKITMMIVMIIAIILAAIVSHCKPCKKCEPCKPCKTTMLNNFNDTNGKFLSFNNHNSPSSIFFGVLTILLMMTFIKHNFEIFRKNEAMRFAYTGIGCVVMLCGLYLILM